MIEAASRDYSARGASEKHSEDCRPETARLHDTNKKCDIITASDGTSRFMIFAALFTLRPHTKMPNAIDIGTIYDRMMADACDVETEFPAHQFGFTTLRTVVTGSSHHDLSASLRISALICRSSIAPYNHARAIYI